VHHLPDRAQQVQTVQNSLSLLLKSTSIETMRNNRIVTSADAQRRIRLLDNQWKLSTLNWLNINVFAKTETWDMNRTWQGGMTICRCSEIETKTDANT